MAWTTPMTAVVGSVFTAAQFNTHVRDNLLETGAAKATTDGELIVSAGANSLVARRVVMNSVAASESTTLTAYGDLTTAGPSISTTTGARVLIAVSAQITGTAAAAGRMGVDVSGASTSAASSTLALTQGGSTVLQAASYTYILASLTPGVNVFTAKYSSTSGGVSVSFANRRLLVMPLS